MALVFNGTNQYANATLTTAFLGNLEFTIACSFKTGATVTGVTQYPFHVNRAPSTLRGWGVEISTTGQIRAFGYNGSFSYTASLATAQPNTIYYCVIKKTTSGLVTFYLNTFSNSATVSKADNSTYTRIILGALYNNSYQGYFGGKTCRPAFWQQILSSADIQLLLQPLPNPSATSVTPLDYWPAISSDTQTNGSNALVRTGATYDSDTLSQETILSANGGNPIPAGSSFTANTSGFTTVTSGSIGGKALTGVSWASNVATATYPAYVDGQTFPEPDTNQTLILSDGVSSAQFTVATDPPVWMTSVVVASPDNSDPQKIGSALAAAGYAPVNNDRLVYTPAEITLSPDTSGSAPEPVVTTIWHWVQSTGIIYGYQVTINEAGIVESVVRVMAPSSSKITARGIVARGIVAR